MKLFGKGKKAKGKTVAKLKGYVDIKNYYPDVHIIRTSEQFLKAYRIDDPDITDRKIYEEELKKYAVDQVGISTQIISSSKGIYVIIGTKTDCIEDALEIFENLGYPGEPISIAEWMEVIAWSTQGQDFVHMDKIGFTTPKGKPKGSIVPYLEPYAAETAYGADGKAIVERDFKILKTGKRYTRTVMISSFPQTIFSSMCTEIIKISDSIQTSLFVRPIDKEACLYALDHFEDKLQKNLSIHGVDGVRKLLTCEEPLMDTALFISVAADTALKVNELVEQITQIAAQYMVEINPLDHQQTPAFKSMIPLGKAWVKGFKVLGKSDLLGCLPLSWGRHMETGIAYGKDVVSGRDLLYDRTKAKGIGFILGSNGKIVEERILKEAKQIAEAGKNVAIYAIDTTLTPKIATAYPATLIMGPLIQEGDTPGYRDSVYKAALFGILGGTSRRDLSESKKDLMTVIMQQSYHTLEEFKEAVLEQDSHLATKLSVINNPLSCSEESEESGVHFYVCQGDRYQTRILQLMQAAYRSHADAIYVLNADLICNSGIFKVLKTEHPNKIYTLSSVSKDGGGIRELYASKGIQTLIQQSDFIDITQHTVLDRLHLGKSLNFDKAQKQFLTTADEQSGILISGDAMHSYNQAG